MIFRVSKISIILYLLVNIIFLGSYFAEDAGQISTFFDKLPAIARQNGVEYSTELANLEIALLFVHLALPFASAPAIWRRNIWGAYIFGVSQGAYFLFYALSSSEIEIFSKSDLFLELVTTFLGGVVLCFAWLASNEEVKNATHPSSKL